MSSTDFNDLRKFIIDFEKNKSPQRGLFVPDPWHSLEELQDRLRQEFPTSNSIQSIREPPGPRCNPSLTIAESDTEPQVYAMTEARSLASSATKYTLVFDTSGISITSSHTSGPSRRGQQPFFHRARPPVPLNMVPHELPCDFERFSGCEARFRHDQVDDMVEHVATQHLNNNLPAHCKCQFCDTVEFVAHPDNPDNLRACFRARTMHHAMHFQEGLTKRQMRPDFPFVDHLRQNNFIDQATFEAAIQTSELSRALGKRVEIEPNRPRKRMQCEITIASRRNAPRAGPSRKEL